MKAPDKIYMPNELLSEEWQRHIEGEDTEYVRADVFIKRACEYAAKHFLVMDREIENFKNYMEGKERRII